MADIEYGHQSPPSKSQQPSAESPTIVARQCFTANHRRCIITISAVTALLIALAVPISLMLKDKQVSSKEAIIAAAAAASGEPDSSTDTGSSSHINSHAAALLDWDYEATEVNESITQSTPTQPTSARKTTFFFGDLSITNDDLGIEISAGLSVRLVATAGEQVEFSNGEKSNLKYHTMTDGAGVIELDHGSYAYVANSEESSGNGGVYGLYFDSKGNVHDYRVLMKGTTRNCSGGISPWNTWISCEEYGRGQCHQIEPNPNRENFDKPKATLLGAREGGRYEAVAVDNTNPDKPVFYITEDHKYGALRRFVANGQGWDALHQDGDTSFLHIQDDETFEWTTDQALAMSSAHKYYMNSEGISFHEGRLYVMAKVERKMVVLDLETMTYTTEITGKKLYGAGQFTNQPDQVIVGPSRKFLYFTEDGGDSPGVYVRFSGDETYSTMFQGIPGGLYSGDETVGIALSPDNLRFYAGFQDAGVILEFTRDDGLPFQ